MQTSRHARWLGYLLAVLIVQVSANAQTTFTWTGAVNNNWNNSGNWTKVGTSTSTWPNQNASQNDQAIINSGSPVINASFTNSSLTSVTINAPGVLAITAGNTLTISGPLSGSGEFSQSAGTLNVSGNVTLTTLSLSGGAFVYTGTGSQSVKDAAYATLQKSGAGTATLAGNATAGAVTVSAGTLALADFDLSCSSLAGAGALTMGAGTLTLSGNNTHSGTFTPGTGTVVYSGGAQTVRGTTYNNLTFSAAGTKTSSGALTVNGIFSNTNATLAMGGAALNLTGTVTNSGGSMTSTSSVTYNSASAQDVLPGTAGSLTKNGSGTATLTGNLTSAGAITLTAGTLDFSNFNLSGTTLSGSGTLNGGSGTLTLTGSNTHSGTFNAGTSTVVYNVNGTQTIQGYGATGYYNLTISNGNTKTLANALTVNNIFLFNGSGTFSGAGFSVSFNHYNQTNGTVNFGVGGQSYSGNFHKTGGNFTTGSGPLAFSGTGFFRSNAAIVPTSGSASVSGIRTIQSTGTLTLTNLSVSGTLSNKTALVVNTALTGAGTFSNDSSAAVLDVNFTGAGPSVTTFDVSAQGTVRYSAAGVQTTRAAAYYNLATATSGTKTLSVGTTVGNNLVLGSPTDCSFSIAIPGSVSGTSSFNLTGNSSLTVAGNYTATGGLTIAGTGAFNAQGNVSHGAGALNFNSSAVQIDGILNGSGNVTVSGTGSLNFTGGGWTSTTGTFNSGSTTTTYSGTSGSQTIRATTYGSLVLSGAATKNYGAGTGSVDGNFDNQTGQTLIYPTSVASLSLNGSVTGTGKILGDPNGSLTVGSAGTVFTSLGTLYFDTTKVMGTINFNRQWNRALQVTIGSSVRMNYYTFLGGFTVGSVEIVDNEVFKVESPVVTPTSTLATNVGRLRYIMLGVGSKFVFQPTGTIPAGTNLTFGIGPNPNATQPWQLLQGNANGTLNAISIGGTNLTGTNTNFQDQLLEGYDVVLSDGTVVGTVETMNSSLQQLTLKAPGALVNVPAGSTFRLIQAYRPVTIIPSAPVTGGSIEVSMLNHSGGPVTSATNIPDEPSNRRLNYIFRVRATAGFPTSAIWTEGLLSNDFNATIDDAKYSFFRWNGSFWVKLAADLVGPGAVPSNIQIRRNSVVMPGVQTYILGQTGGVLPDDPTFSWTGAGGTNLWKNAGNWNVFPAGAGPWPDDIGHNVIISSGGIGGPVIASGDSINVKHITHNAKLLTIQNGGILNVVGHYSFNQPTLTAAGDGRLIQSGLNITGTNGSQFLTQLIPGSLLYTTEGGFIGAVRSIGSNTSLTLQSIGGGTPVNIPDSSTFNIITPTISAGGGNLTAATSSNVVTGTGFTSALNGRCLYIGANQLVGMVSYVQSATSLILVANSFLNATNQPYLVSSAITPSGSGTTDFQNGSRVNYNSSLADQTIAATSYSWINMVDSRVGASSDLVRYVNCPGRSVTVRGRFRGRVHVKPAASLGPIWQFQNGSRMSLIFPTGSSTSNGGTWNNFSTNGVAGQYNVRWGNLSTDRIHYDGLLQNNANFNFPAMDAQIGNRFGDFTLINTAASARWILTPGMSLTVNGTATFTNTSGPANNVLGIGNSTANPVVSLSLLGPVVGANNLTTAGSPVHLANLTIGGSGSISGDLFESIAQLRNLTVSRPSATLSLSGALNLAVTEKITLTAGTFGHTGSGTVTAGSAAASGIDLAGGTLAMSGSSNLSLISSGAFTISSGTANLTNTGTVSVAGNFSQTGGTFNRIGLPATFQGSVSATGGVTDFTGSTITLSGTNAQDLTGSVSGLTFQNLTVNKTGGAVSVVAGKVKITGTLHLPVGNSAAFNTTPSGNLTLVSNASGTGRIATIGGGSIGGSNWTMERFVNGGVQGWYFLGSPVSGQTLGNWGDDFDITTPLTCSGTTTDLIPRNTVYRFAGDAVPADGPTPYEAYGWRAPGSCSVTLGEGYRAFLNTKFFTYGSTFENTGTMNSGNTPLPVTFNSGGYQGGGWNLVSNPMPSNIDWNAGTGWTKTNILNSIYVWKGDSNQYGSYVSGIGTNGVDNIIPSGQAFFVKTNTSPVLSVNENAKTATAKSFMRTAVEEEPIVRVSLEGPSSADEMVVHFRNGSTDGFDSDQDAYKLLNPGINVYSVVGESKYSINGLSFTEPEKVVTVGVSNCPAGNYQLRFTGIQTLPTGATAMLKDHYLNQITDVSEGQVVTLSIGSDAASQGEGRFELVFTHPNSVTRVMPSQTGKGIKVFPNPTRNGEVAITTGGISGWIQITDLVGRVVLQQPTQGQELNLRFALPAGVYSVELKANEGASQKTRLVVE